MSQIKVSTSSLVQDLRQYKFPKNFRGRSAIYVQLWWFVQSTLFRWSPQVLYGWRSFLLKLFGARLGKKVLIRPTAEITYPWKLTIGDFCWIGDRVTLYTLGEITIGSNVVVSQGSYVCAASHDYTVPGFDIYDDPVHINSEAWVAAEVFVGPGVRVGRGAVVGARSVVLNDLPELMLCAGHPAIPVRPRLS